MGHLELGRGVGGNINPKAIALSVSSSVVWRFSIQQKLVSRRIPVTEILLLEIPCARSFLSGHASRVCSVSRVACLTLTTSLLG